MKRSLNGLTKKIKKVPARRASDRLKSIYHRRSFSKHAPIIAVVGDDSACLTARMINSILIAHGEKTAILTSDETSNILDETVEFRRFLTEARRARATFLIVEVTPDLAQYLSGRLEVHMAVMTCLVTPRSPEIDPLVKSQMHLFENEPPFIVLNRDEPWFDLFDEFLAGNLKLNYGTDDASNVRITKTKFYKKGAEATLALDPNTDLEVATYSTSDDAPEAMAAAATAATLLGIPHATIQDGIADLEP